MCSFPPEHISAGIRCASCDYVGPVTGNPNRPEFDRTPYSVWVELDGTNLARAIAAVGRITGLGITESRALIEAGQPFRMEADALEVRHLHKELAGRELHLRTEPHSPWRLE